MATNNSRPRFDPWRRIPRLIFSALLTLLLIGVAGQGVWAAAVDTTGVQIKVEHLIFNPSEGALQAFAIYQFTNSGDADVPQIEIDLPGDSQAFQAVQGLDDGTYELQDNHLISNQPLAAGETREIMFYFSLPWDGQSYKWSQTVIYPTDLLFVLVPEGALGITGNDLTRGEIQAIDSTDYRQFYALDLATDQGVAAQVVPGTGTSSDTGDSSASGSEKILNKGFHGGQANVELWMRMTGRPDHFGWAGVVGFGAGILLIGGLVTGVRTRWFHRLGAPDGDTAPGDARQQAGLSTAEVATLSEEDLNQHREVLMKRLVRLELEHQRGEQNEASYSQLRKDLLKQLARIELARKNQAGN